MKYLVFLFLFIITNNLQAIVNHIAQQPQDGKAKVFQFLSVLSSFNSIEALKKDLEDKSEREIEEIYTFKTRLENGKIASLCILCQSTWRRRDRPCGGFTWHLENHLNFYRKMKMLNDQNQLIQEAGTHAEKPTDNPSSSDGLSTATGIGAMYMQDSMHEAAGITNVEQLMDDDANTCLVCFQIRQPLEKTDDYDGPLNKMDGHIGNHLREEQRSERVCKRNAEVYEQHFSNLNFTSAVQRKKEFFEGARKNKQDGIARRVKKIQ